MRINKSLIIIIILILCSSAIMLIGDIEKTGVLTTEKIYFHSIATVLSITIATIIVLSVQRFFRKIGFFFTRNIFSSSTKKRCEHDSNYESPKYRKKFTKNDFENPDFDPKFLDPNDIDDYIEYILEKNKLKSPNASDKSYSLNGVQVSRNDFRRFILEEMGIDANINEFSRKRTSILSCKNCGAPLTPGTKKCPYCESTIIYN